MDAISIRTVQRIQVEKIGTNEQAPLYTDELSGVKVQYRCTACFKRLAQKPALPLVAAALRDLPDFSSEWISTAVRPPIPPLVRAL